MNSDKIVLLFACILCCFQTRNAVDAPKITIEDPKYQPFYAVEGRDFNITCKVRDVQAPAPNSVTVLWYRNDVLINSNKETGFTTLNVYYNETRILHAILNKPVFTKEDAGRYKCQEKNDPEQHYSIDIKVSKIVPEHCTAKPKDSCKLSCDVKGELEKSQYELEWHRNDIIITNQEDKYVIHEANNTLEIIKIDFEHDLGEYVCVAKLENSQTHNFTAYVYGVAYIQHFDKSKNLVEDDSLNLTCKAAGYPVPVVTWFHDKNPINTTSDRITYTDYKDVVNASIKIKKMQFEDAGEYSCEAINEIDSIVYNATEQITVRVKDSLNQKPAIAKENRWREGDKLAALWPFLGICVEVTILCIIIFIYERHRNKKLAEEDAKEEAGHLTNSNANRDDVRQRKV